MAKVRLQNLILVLLFKSEKQHCWSVENFVSSNGNSFALGKREWLDLKPSMCYASTQRPKQYAWLGSQKIINHEREALSIEENVHTACVLQTGREQSGNFRLFFLLNANPNDIGYPQPVGQSSDGGRSTSLQYSTVAILLWKTPVVHQNMN